jgi:hypothetical protein
MPILSTQTILSLYSQFFEAMKIWILGELPGRLHYIPIADVTNGSYIAMSTNPEFPYKIFRMYYGSGYVPYTAKDRGTGSHYSTIYSQSFSEWLEKVLDTYGAFGIDA